MKRSGTAILALTAILAVAAIFYLRQPDGDDNSAGEALAEVRVPALSDGAKAGEALFNANCAKCHGNDAAGRKGLGPPLVHKIYEPGHHGDRAFYLAASQGVRQHHWPFGDMAPVEGVSEPDVAQIIVYVRELQRANGIN